MPKLILIIDDIANNRYVIKRILQDEDYLIREKEDAEDAFKYLNNPDNRLPDLIILDLNMPGMGGENFAHILNSMSAERKEIRDIPIIIHSAYVDKKIVNSLNDKVYAFLSKPVDPERLVEEVNKIFEDNTD